MLLSFGFVLFGNLLYLCSCGGSMYGAVKLICLVCRDCLLLLATASFQTQCWLGSLLAPSRPDTVTTHLFSNAVRRQRIQRCSQQRRQKCTALALEEKWAADLLCHLEGTAFHAFRAADMGRTSLNSTPQTVIQPNINITP